MGKTLKLTDVDWSQLSSYFNTGGRIDNPTEQVKYSNDDSNIVVSEQKHLNDPVDLITKPSDIYCSYTQHDSDHTFEYPEIHLNTKMSLYPDIKFPSTNLAHLMCNDRYMFVSKIYSYCMQSISLCKDSELPFVVKQLCTGLNICSINKHNYKDIDNMRKYNSYNCSSSSVQCEISKFTVYMYRIFILNLLLSVLSCVNYQLVVDCDLLKQLIKIKLSCVDIYTFLYASVDTAIRNAMKNVMCLYNTDINHCRINIILNHLELAYIE